MALLIMGKPSTMVPTFNMNRTPMVISPTRRFSNPDSLTSSKGRFPVKVEINPTELEFWLPVEFSVVVSVWV